MKGLTRISLSVAIVLMSTVVQAAPYPGQNAVVEARQSVPLRTSPYDGGLIRKLGSGERMRIVGENRRQNLFNVDIWIKLAPVQGSGQIGWSYWGKAEDKSSQNFR